MYEFYTTILINSDIGNFKIVIINHNQRLKNIGVDQTSQNFDHNFFLACLMAIFEEEFLFSGVIPPISEFFNQHKVRS